MPENPSEKIASILDGLTQKVESLENQKSSEFKSNADIMAGLEKLIQKLNLLEDQQVVDKELAKKLDRILSQVDKLAERQSNTKEEKQMQLEDTFRKWLKITKVSGRILEIFAGSLEVLVDAVIKLIKEQSRATTRSSPNNTTSQLDLSSLLTSINNFIQELAHDSKHKD